MRFSMNATGPVAARPRTSLSRVASSIIVALAGTFSLACHHEEPAPAATSAAPDPSSAPSVAKAEYHEDTFDLTIKSTAPLIAGAPGVVEVQLAAKGGYHCNDKYPYKFKTGDSPGVKFAAPVFTKDALTLEEKRATMKVDLTPETKGDKAVRGVFAFSLCSVERCLVEKRDLETTIAVN